MSDKEINKPTGAEALMRAMSDIDDRFIAEAEEGARITRTVPLWLKRTAAWAACLALCITAVAAALGSGIFGKGGDYDSTMDGAPGMNGGGSGGSGSMGGSSADPEDSLIYGFIGYGERVTVGGTAATVTLTESGVTLTVEGTPTAKGLAVLIICDGEGEKLIYPVGIWDKAPFEQISGGNISLMHDALTLTLDGEVIGTAEVPREGGFVLTAQISGGVPSDCRVILTDFEGYYALKG